MATHEYDTILDRLTEILARLNNGEALSVKELAKDFNVSDRTIQRDFNKRLGLHYPIYRDGKKWKMQDGFKLEKLSSVEDTVVLDIVQRLVEGAGTTFAAKANKLLSKIKNESLNPIYAKLDMEDIGDKLQEIQKLEHAIKEKRQINCFYTPLDQPTVQIDLKPLKIANYEGYWYLIALDSRNDILKKYYLKSIKQITILDTTFESNKKLDKLLDNSISVWFKAEVEPYRVTLQISSKVAEYFTRKPISKSQITESVYEDGGMVVSIEVTDDREIIPFVKYWIPHIKVLEPTRIQDAIESDLKVYI
ncbi:YafY family protein [Sulfurovum sp. AR]|uniref:helix-turn-helix transcriptional regulator n=1 Tax=Sulfurovum sp. AR TaxID=1165841 RepID=UPI00025C4CB8|nr:WYL domain-containing protein [Sulfurovum sp. AR]EIF51360.1 transcriptional regulator [Sulfurovum sp. AR]